ncbi:MAG: isoprenylcysteine carboxylmethyltransferase family protein [bacterium]
MKSRFQDILFILFAVVVIPFCYWTCGMRGLAVLAWAFFLPLYVLRLVIWSFWTRLKSWLSAKCTAISWNILAFGVGGTLGIIVWFVLSTILNVPRFILPKWLQMLGFLIATVGLILALWAQWLLGLQTAILTTRIFGKDKQEERRVVSTGPYAIFPHPIFLGEWLTIIGCFLLTSQISLLMLLLIAFLSDMFAASREERDLQERFGEEYKTYRSRFSVWKQL